MMFAPTYHQLFTRPEIVVCGQYGNMFNAICFLIARVLDECEHHDDNHSNLKSTYKQTFSVERCSAERLNHSLNRSTSELG